MKCRACGYPVEKGERKGWIKGNDEAMHADCIDEHLARTKPVLQNELTPPREE